MVLIGSLEIYNQEDVFMLRNKARLMALHLQYSEITATRFASFISETCRIIGIQQLSHVQLSLQEDTRMLEIEFTYNHSQSIDLTDSFEHFFNSIQITANENSGTVHLTKSLPENLGQITEQLVDQTKAVIIRLSEQELLAELERKNEQLREAYETLQRSQEELLTRTAQLAKVGGWEINLDDNSLQWTDEVYRIHELPKGAKPKLEDGINFYPPDARAILVEAINKAMEQGIPWDLELPFITAKGNHRWVRAMGFPERKNDVTVRLSGMIKDITQQKTFEKELEQKNQRLEFQNKELEQFVYVASHDLQEPLRTITGYVEVLEDTLTNQLNESNKRYLGHIVDAANRMRILIKDLLDYSRIGRSTTMEDVDTQMLVETILADLNHSINASEAEVKITSTLPVVKCQKVGLKQLLQNLIANAIKFRHPEVAPFVEISVKESRNDWQFTVADNGIGIEKKHSDRIFTIFQRLHTRDDYAGTGIGLALCKKVVELHGGRIWLESELGVGTSFYFTIPKVQ